MPFRDRAEAGQQLAAKLMAYANRPDVTVLALARGGIPVGREVAAALGAPLDVLVVKRLLARSNCHEVTIGAIAGGGVRVIDDDLCRALSIPAETIEQIVEREQAEVEDRERFYHRCYRPPRGLRDRTVIIVDDGMVTGASIGAAVRAVRNCRPAATVVAVPVASYSTCADLGRVVQEIVYCFIRDPVYAVSLWYSSYPSVSDAEACRILTSGTPRSSASPEHYRELGADATAAREEAFEDLGFPGRGPELGEPEERGAEPRHPMDDYVRPHR